MTQFNRNLPLGQPVITLEEFESIISIYIKCTQQPNLYILSKETNSIEIDPNHLLSNNNNKDDDTEHVKLYNSFINHIQTLIKHLISRVTKNFTVKQLCYHLTRSIRMETRSSAKGYECAFTHEINDKNNVNISFYYMDSNNDNIIKQSDWYTVSAAWCSWLQGILLVQNYIPYFINDQLKNNNEQFNVSRNYTQIYSVIQFIWEWVHPLIT